MTTMLDKTVHTVTLPAGKQLTIVTDASGEALVTRYQGDVLIDKTSVSSSSTRVFGEYLIDITVEIYCITGTLTYAESQSTDVTGAAALAQMSLVTATAKTLLSTDIHKYVRLTNTAAKTVTVSSEAHDAAFSIGWECTVANRGATGDLTLLADTGVTLNAPAAGTLVLSPGMSVTLKRYGTNTFDVIGQTVAA